MWGGAKYTFMELSVVLINKVIYGTSQNQDTGNFLPLSTSLFKSEDTVSYVAVCPRSSDPFYIVSYYIKCVTTSWTHKYLSKYCVSNKYSDPFYIVLRVQEEVTHFI